MSGRDRLEIGTYGDISTIATSSRTVRAEARFRDWDGVVRKVTAAAHNAKAAKHALRAKLASRSSATGFGTALTPESTMGDLAAAWLEDVQRRPDLAPSSKELYRREVDSLILPTFRRLRLREVTTGRVDHFLSRQAAVSFAHARHSKTLLSLLFNFALRQDAVAHNPVVGASRIKRPKMAVKALTLDELEQVRQAAATWRSGKKLPGPKPDGQVPELIEVLIGTGGRIGEALALRKCDIDDSRRTSGKPMRVTVSGTIVTITGKGTYRQDYPKTDNSRRTLEVPEFTADIIRGRLQLTTEEDDRHLLFFSRRGTPLTPYNVRRTLRAMLKEAGIELKVPPHTFWRTGGTVIARAADSQAAADALGNTKQVAERHYIAANEPAPISAPAMHLTVLAPRSRRQRLDEGVLSAD